MTTVLVLSGPNLNLLGEREPEIYGSATLADHVDTATAAGRRLGLEVEHRQSNHEGELITAVHEARGSVAAIVVNAGALAIRRGRCTMHWRPSKDRWSSCISPIQRPASRSATRRWWRRWWQGRWRGSVAWATRWRWRRLLPCWASPPPMDDIWLTMRCDA